jgi:uncharacterized protein
MSFSVDKKVIIKTIQSMNQHIPPKRRNLVDLLSDEKPGVRGKDNTFYIMDKPELDLISSSIPRFLWQRLRLPILIEMSPELGSGAARIQGQVESEAVAKILGKEKPQGDTLVIYLHEIKELRHKLPTTTQYAFVTNLRDIEKDF